MATPLYGVPMEKLGTLLLLVPSILLVKESQRATHQLGWPLETAHPHPISYGVLMVRHGGITLLVVLPRSLTVSLGMALFGWRLEQAQIPSSGVLMGWTGMRPLQEDSEQLVMASHGTGSCGSQ